MQAALLSNPKLAISQAMKTRTKHGCNLEHLIADVPNWRLLHRPGHPPRILANPKLRAFIDRALPRMTFEQIAAACIEKFGAGEAPSRSAIQRYWANFAEPGLAQQPSSVSAKRQNQTGKSQAALPNRSNRGGRVSAKTR